MPKTLDLLGSLTTFMDTKYHQISLNEVFSDCQTKLIEEKPETIQPPKQMSF